MVTNAWYAENSENVCCVAEVRVSPHRVRRRQTCGRPVGTEDQTRHRERIRQTDRPEKVHKKKKKRR